MSGDAENEYFSDGLTETLLHMLSQMPELTGCRAHVLLCVQGKKRQYR